MCGGSRAVQLMVSAWRPQLGHFIAGRSRSPVGKNCGAPGRRVARTDWMLSLVFARRLLPTSRPCALVVDTKVPLRAENLHGSSISLHLQALQLARRPGSSCPPSLVDTLTSHLGESSTRPPRSRSRRAHTTKGAGQVHPLRDVPSAGAFVLPFDLQQVFGSDPCTTLARPCESSDRLLQGQNSLCTMVAASRFLEAVTRHNFRARLTAQEKHLSRQTCNIFHRLPGFRAFGRSSARLGPAAFARSDGARKRHNISRAFAIVDCESACGSAPYLLAAMTRLALYTLLKLGPDSAAGGARHSFFGDCECGAARYAWASSSAL